MSDEKIEGFQKIIDTYTPEDKAGIGLLRYQCHLNDPARKMSFGGRMYYRIVSLERVNYDNTSHLLCQISTELPFKIGDTLMDELGNRYIVCGIEHIHYLPEYEFLTKAFVTVILEPPDDEAPVGEYMAAYHA